MAFNENSIDFKFIMSYSMCLIEGREYHEFFKWI